jgi:CheY-like chemotaxis protein
MLQPVTAQTLALALHELATNAVKHGALSTPSGRVSLTWELQPHSLVILWDEAHGRDVSPPASHGVGTRIINASIEGQLGGTAVFDWRPTGLHCTLVIPRSNEQGAPPFAPAAQQRTGISPVRQRRAASRRVLLVEDEALVAIMMGDILREVGFSVVGPYARVGEAVVAATEEEVEAAVLDVNLGGELVYPVADTLAARGVPFVFVTGYGPERIDGRFARVPVLQKPIQSKDLESAFSSAKVVFPLAADHA